MLGERLAETDITGAANEVNRAIFDLCCEGLESGRYTDATEMGVAYNKMIGLLGATPVHEAVTTLSHTKGSTPDAEVPSRPQVLVGVLQR